MENITDSNRIRNTLIRADTCSSFEYQKTSQAIISVYNQLIKSKVLHQPQTIVSKVSSNYRGAEVYNVNP